MTPMGWALLEEVFACVPLPPRVRHRASDGARRGGEGLGVGGLRRVPNFEQRGDARTGNARRLRRATTDAEKKLWWHLRQLPIARTHFRRQAPIGPYYADFACHAPRLVIELDGSQHAKLGAVAADARRTAYLNARGYRVLRFWNNDVLQNIESVMTAIHAVLAERAPHP